jgi:hypothetical protein
VFVELPVGEIADKSSDMRNRALDAGGWMLVDYKTGKKYQKSDGKDPVARVGIGTVNAGIVLFPKDVTCISTVSKSSICSMRL